MGFVERYVALLYKLRWGVLAGWLVIIAVATPFAPRLISATTNSFAPPKGTPADQANALVGLHFPALNPLNTQLVVYIEAVDGAPVLRPGLAAMQVALLARLSNYSAPGCSNPCIATYASYYTYLDEGLPQQLADALVSPSNESAIIAIAVNVPFVAAASVDFAQAIERWLRHDLAVPGLQMTLEGVPAFLPVLQSAVERDMGLMDGIVLPLAMLVLCWMLSSARLMLVPLATTLSAFVTSFSLTYVVALHFNIVSFVPRFVC